MSWYEKINDRIVYPSILINSIITIVFVLISYSCKKDGWSPYAADDGLWGILTARPWHVTSSTKTDNNGKMINRYLGSQTDSVHFMIGPGQYFGDVVLTNISSFIGGASRLMSYSIPLDDHPHRTGLVLAYPDWKIGYSDSMLITYYANEYLVFKVKDSVGTGYEIDSLYRTY